MNKIKNKSVKQNYTLVYHPNPKLTSDTQVNIKISQGNSAKDLGRGGRIYSTFFRSFISDSECETERIIKISSYVPKLM